MARTVPATSSRQTELAAMSNTGTALPTRNVAAAIVVHEGKVLGARRFMGNEFDGFWEFPGGKIEPGESYEDATIREMQEELEAVVRIERHYQTTSFEYPKFHLHMETYLCTLVSDPAQIHLSAHDDYRWFALDELKSVQWLPAAYEMLDRLQAEGTGL